jgi:hypothetical protein
MKPVELVERALNSRKARDLVADLVGIPAAAKTPSSGR